MFHRTCFYSIFFKKLTTVQDGKSLDILLSFMTYGTTHGQDKSGAYLFLPDGPAQVIVLDEDT